MTDNLHSPQRRLIELRIEHADLDNLIDHSIADPSTDELALRRLKKRRLALRDEIARLEAEVQVGGSPLPDEPA
ncbi:MAG TPA: YdcH family protein [Rubrivivax sp.]|nr:YdcH family protein [Burkholderiales bacterium]HNU10411.1 YdcH family protein [Rubrivivax sp.]